MVSIVGRPNAGKSTLLNTLLETQLSIVTPKAQTTRDRINGIYHKDEGQIVFIDTPGIHNANEDSINSYMVSQAVDTLKSVDAIWYLVDFNSELKHEEVVLGFLEKASCPIFLIMNKVDQMKNPKLLAELKEALNCTNDQVQTFEISAKEGTHLNQLIAATWEVLPIAPFLYPDPEQLSDRPIKYFVSELIREQTYLQLNEEVPYSCAVNIEKYDESRKPIHIYANILVERDSQKGILVGKKGSQIKSIGQSSRAKIESLLGEKVFLGLQVKVNKNWTKSPDRLKQLGYVLGE